ncbi:N-acetylmuramoyl-L-alanine amidase [Candidatus Pelagibacter communis]|uniref:N-acetylmuramoyl-L-alanine amidase n=1 Tax=Pelagibacter ubique TaxID=198252 RepID=UPI00094CA7BD|nr:N-acetylmuramoyl-L-alanine amidase [Candidatus Pelagibacter ubique]
MKINPNYSPNFDSKKRSLDKINFIIFHYTGMKNEKKAIDKLLDIKSKVSCHYFIKNNGEILRMVPDSYIAWHAGVSSWKKFKSLNKSSIGIEINNPGHEFKYKKFSKKQIYSLIKLTRYIIKKYKINPKSVLGHSDIAPDRKRDPGEKFPWEFLSKKKIGIWHELKSNEIKVYRKLKLSNLLKIKFINNLYKIGYPKNSKINKNKYNKNITVAFQRRFRQELIDGKIDKECLLISENLIKKLN